MPDNNRINNKYERSIVDSLESRISERRKFIQIVTGPRQTGKTTAIRQAVEKITIPYRYVSADTANTHSAEWLKSEWQQARNLLSNSPAAIFIVDEVQNIEQWSSIVKTLWDEDSWTGIDLRVILSGSSSLLLQKGLSESLMGRFEILPSTHWSYLEMYNAFGYTLDEYLWFGGYPAGAMLKETPDRWKQYVNDAIIEATLSKDIFQMEEIRKPALMRKLFMLGSQYSAQEISFRKILGQLDDKGNTSTIAHYLDLLSSAGLLCGLQKYNPKDLVSRKSSPRLMVYDTSLITATSGNPNDLLGNPNAKGHLVESAVGAYLLARSRIENFEVLWWREDNLEVDFVIKKDNRATALEVKSGRVKNTKGLLEIQKKFPGITPLIIGDSNASIDDFLLGKIDLQI